MASNDPHDDDTPPLAPRWFLWLFGGLLLAAGAYVLLMLLLVLGRGLALGGR